MTRRTTTTLRRLTAAGAALALTASLASCSDNPLSDQYRAGDNKGFIAADGFRVVEIPTADRGQPVTFQGVLDTGDAVTSDEYAGDVLVVNFWYAACAPCRVEAPELEAAHEAFADEDVSFLGVNIYDGAAAATAFADTYGVTYPSALATVDASVNRKRAARVRSRHARRSARVSRWRRSRARW